jgi:hypothetical protein
MRREQVGGAHDGGCKFLVRELAFVGFGEKEKFVGRGGGAFFKKFW